MCLCVCVLVGGGAAGIANTRVVCVCVCVRDCVPVCTGLGPGCAPAGVGDGCCLRGKRLSGSVALLIVRAYVFVCVRAQERARLCSAACADENRVAALHLKGAVINEMNKRP